MWGRLQRYVNSVKNDISNEMDLEAASKMKQNFMRQVGEVEQQVKSAQLSLEQQILQAQYRQTPPIEPIDASSINDTTKPPQ
jgi:hypothetical protein